MPTETLAAPQETKYSHKSFELVFSKFCEKYAENLSGFQQRGPKDGSDGHFMGLSKNASVQQMNEQLNAVGETMGDPPDWKDNESGSLEMRDAILLSARYLAWHATMGSITTQYLDRLDEHRESQRRRGMLNGAGQQSLQKLRYYKEVGLSLVLAQNHAIRDYFDSPLAATLGNDSPEGMHSLLASVPYSTESRKDSLLKGIALEIAAKRQVEGVVAGSGRKVAYGSDEQDSRGGDLVVVNDDEVLFIDLKSKMPSTFADESRATPEDDARGYKWIDHDYDENKVAVWAYEAEPVSPGSFSLQDQRLVHNLDLVVNSSLS